MFNHIIKVSLSLYFLLTLSFFPYFSITSLVFFGIIFLIALAHHKFEIKYLSWLRFPLLIGGIFIIYSEYGTWKGLGPASSLFSILSLLKLFELGKKRDLYSLICIFILYLLSLCLLVEDFYYLFILVVSIFTCFYLLFCAEQLEVNDSSVFFSARKIFLLFLQALPFIIMLMLFFPRLHFGGFFFSKNVGKTGFSEYLEPGSISELIKDSSTVFHANFQKKKRTSELYWRGQVLNLNEGFIWKKGSIPERFSKKAVGVRADYQVKLHELVNGPVFALEGTERVKLLSSGTLRKYKAGIFYTDPLMNQKTSYQGYLSVKKKANLKKGFKNNYLQLNIGKSRSIENLILKNKEIIGKSEKTKNFLVEFFKENFKYSTSPGSYVGPSALSDFLFKRKLGFCGHYAAASATLFRSFGIPARVIVGYQGGSYNEVGNFYLISQRDAHSWVEYLDDQGIWQRFDAVEYVAPERINFGGETYIELERLRFENKKVEDFLFSRSSLVNRWKQYIQSVYYQSGTMFFNYDLELQKTLLKKIKNYKFSFSYFIRIILTICLILMSLFMIFKLSTLVEIILFLNLNKSKRTGWRRFKCLTYAQLEQAMGESSKKKLQLLSNYQDVKYSGNASLTLKLSFILKGIRILIYE